MEIAPGHDRTVRVLDTDKGLLLKMRESVRFVPVLFALVGPGGGFWREETQYIVSQAERTRGGGLNQSREGSRESAKPRDNKGLIEHSQFPHP